jgi:hypothetical protein
MRNGSVGGKTYFRACVFASELQERQEAETYLRVSYMLACGSNHDITYSESPFSYLSVSTMMTNV